MKIHEYQAKQILARYNIPIPRGELAATPAEARSIAKSYGVPVVVKAQVLVGGRGKAGGVKLAATPDEAEVVAERILGLNIKGVTVRKLLVAAATDIAKEIYLGAVLDRTSQRVVVMASAEGGVEIEEVARTMPEKIVKVAADPFLGLADFQARQLAFGIGLPTNLVRDFVRLAKGLVQAFVDTDASLAEINPLVVAKDGTLRAIDAKIVLDDNGLFRHRDLEALRDLDEEDIYEREARMNELSYVKLDGEIGCMVNGAGLAMATMDMIKLYGSAPANFLDIGGGARAERVAAALRIILSDRHVKAVLFNIFGGITRCDEVARGIVTALQQVKPSVPMVARLIGTNEEEGRRILGEANMITAATLAEAAQKVVAAARGDERRGDEV
ncbi:MAG: ADP-forming succinate--CoA ligase subunit beta [Chloroflexi bacterium]|nr:ADP-forming succinate--CoA ligase subunit beta [Chloroflexota bacterium]